MLPVSTNTSRRSRTISSIAQSRPRFCTSASANSAQSRTRHGGHASIHPIRARSIHVSNEKQKNHKLLLCPCRSPEHLVCTTRKYNPKHQYQMHLTEPYRQRKNPQCLFLADVNTATVSTDQHGDFQWQVGVYLCIALRSHEHKIPIYFGELRGTMVLRCRRISSNTFN